jgi:hypothetical protein
MIFVIENVPRYFHISLSITLPSFNDFESNFAPFSQRLRTVHVHVKPFRVFLRHIYINPYPPSPRSYNAASYTLTLSKTYPFETTILIARICLNNQWSGCRRLTNFKYSQALSHKTDTFIKFKSILLLFTVQKQNLIYLCSH